MIPDESKVVRPQEYYKDKEPLRLSQVQKICPECGGVSDPFVPSQWDSSVSAYRCSSCRYTAESFKFRLKLQNQALGYVDANYLNKPKFEVIENRRNIRSANRKPSSWGQRRSLSREKEELPKLAGKEDIELKYLLQTGVLVNLQDDVLEDDTVWEDRYED